MAAWLGIPLFLPAQYTFQVRRFTTENGLPSNGIKGLQWDDRTGFLWIATEAGIARYNGADFVIFSKETNPGGLSERMLFLSKDRSGEIYTADEAGDIFFVSRNRLQLMGNTVLDTRPSTFKPVGIASSPALFRQSSLHPPRNFGFNFGSDQALPLDDSNLLLLHKDSLYSYILGRMEPVWLNTVWPGGRLFRSENRLFVCSGSHLFYIFDRQPAAHHRVPAEDPIPDDIPLLRPRPVGFADEQAILAQTGTGKGWKLFWETGMKNPILIAGSRAWKLYFEHEKIRAALICTAIPTDALISFACFVEDRGLLFLGTASKGVIQIRKNTILPVKNRNAPDDLSNSCYSQIALPDGNVLTSNGYTLGARDIRPSFLPIRSPFDNFVLLAPDSTLWYSYENTLHGYDYKTGKTSSTGLEYGSVTTGFLQSHDRLFIANAIGIGLLRDGKIDYLYRYPQPDINSNAPFAMIESEPGVLAIACCNGLLRFNVGTKRMDTLLPANGACVRALWRYKEYLFIGTYGKGIYCWKNGIMRPIPIDKNGYLQYAHCFIADRFGYCWISTNKGLFKARLQDMMKAFEDPGSQVYYHYFGSDDGMDMTELNGGCTPCALALNDSTLSFPSMDGLVWVDPRSPVRTPDGQVYIDALYADGTKLGDGDTTISELPVNTRELAISIGFPAWAAKENIYIEYQLLPYSDGWQRLKTESESSIRFSNLPSGDYRLVLRKTNGFGPGNYSSREIRFRIGLHWYQHSWTWVAAFLALITGIVFIIRIRTRQFKIRQSKLEEQIAAKTNELILKNEELEKTDQIKTRLISIISHDLVTPLKFLHLTGKNLLEKKEELPEELKTEMVTEITHTSKELELLSTNILNWIKYRNEERRLEKESFALYQLVGLIYGILGSMAKHKQIRLINTVEERFILRQFIEPVKIVLYNLVLNAINFTREGGGDITINHSLTPDGILIRVTDEGVGMTTEQINNIMADHFIISSANVDNRKGNGLGYLIIKDLLKIIKGSLSIESELSKGSRVSILIYRESFTQVTH